MRNKKNLVWITILLSTVALTFVPQSVKHRIFPVIAVICGPGLILLGLLPLCSARARDRMVRQTVDFEKAKGGFICLTLLGIVSLVIGVCEMTGSAP
jgi:hypothetical protein